jgi:UDP-N-acetyl-D-glucosamine dehydrogenase
MPELTAPPLPATAGTQPAPLPATATENSPRTHTTLAVETPVTTVCVVGLGYVGLPLSLQFAASGLRVIGLDADASKVEALNHGRSYIRHIPSSAIQSAVASRRFLASGEWERVAEASAVVICVPTPLNRNREPDLSCVLNTGRAIAPHLRPGALVVLESTSFPGTTDEDLRGVLEDGSGRVAGRDFHLAFSPEREDPGNPGGGVGAIPKIVGGLTPACLERALALYGRAIRTLVPVSSCRVAEAAKLLENTFRSVNIALVNELKLVYDAMGIDIWEVIAAARTKPFGFMPFYPGPGLGGHCIPIDPFYLTWKAREFGRHTRFIELAGEINTAMPEHVLARVAEALNHRRRALNGSRVLVVGLAYKPDVDDERESPSYVLMEGLRRRGAEVGYHDPYIPEIRPTREHPQWAGTRSLPWTREVISGCDAVIIATAHSTVNYRELVAWSPCIVDTRNAIGAIPARPGQVWKA